MGTEEAPPATNEAETISELESKIIRQVEYYFGNYNLCRDKFLREQVKLNDGWIPMETMVRFNRLKQLSEDFNVITTALKKSPNKLMEVNEDGTKIRRSPEKPVPETQEPQIERSVYVKGFNADATLDELLEYFKQYWEPESVLMRRRKPSKKFKGSVFVTFQKKEDADKFLALKEVKYKGKDLLREYKPDYVKRKNEWYENVKKEREERKKKAAEPKAKNEEGKTDTEVAESDITRGCLLKISGLADDVMWEHIKEVLGKHGKISYVDYSKGSSEAIVRFESPVAAEVIEKAATEGEGGVKTLKIRDKDATIVLIEGDEEVEYWKTVASAKMRLKQKGMKKGWQNRGGKRGKAGGKGNFRKGKKRRHAENDDDDEDAEAAEEEPETKVPKKEANNVEKSQSEQSSNNVETET